jgi:hypothetical protein
MRNILYSILVVAVSAVGGFYFAKNKYLKITNTPQANYHYEKSLSVDMAKNAYALGCLQSFERVCSLLKKTEASRCVNYSGSYCSDASGDYVNKLKTILHGPN